MKKKIIYGLLFAVAMVTASSSFVSCKDYEGDDYADLKERLYSASMNSQTTIDELIRLQQAQIQYQIDNLNDALDRMQASAEKSAAQKIAADAQAALDALMAEYKAATTIDEKLRILSEMNKILQQVTGTSESSSSINVPSATEAIVIMWGDSLRDAYNTAFTAYYLAYRADTLSKNNKARLDSLKLRADSLFNRANVLADSALQVAKNDIINNYFNKLDSAYKAGDNKLAIEIHNLDSLYKAGDKELADLINKLDSAYKAGDSILTVRCNDIEAGYKKADTLLQNQINDLKKDVDALKQDINNILGTLKKQITGIIVQGTYSPVFGYGSLPLGIQTNILAAYAGKATADVQFPSAMKSFDNRNIITEADQTWLEGLGLMPASENITAGQLLFNDETGNAGKMFLTVNPTNVDFSGTNFKLVNSKGYESRIQLSTLEASDEVLTFGWTRGTTVGKTSDNGFYEVTATISKDDALKMQPDFDKAGFKSAVKAAVNNQARLAVKEAARALFNSLQPAERFGVKAEWTDTVGKRSVTSAFDVAALSIEPLGFGFKLPSSKYTRIPTINAKVIADELHINLTIDPIVVTEYDKATGKYVFEVVVDAKELNLSLINEDGKYDAYKTTYKIWHDKNTNGVIDDGEWEEVKVITADNVKKLLNDIQKDTKIVAYVDLTSKFEELFGQFSASFTKFNDAVGGINKQIDNIAAQVNSYVDRANNWINRINNVLDNLGNAVQPVLTWSDGKNAGELGGCVSANWAVGTVIPQGGQVALTATSYSLELFAPAYKKSLIVTNAYKNGFAAQGSAGKASGLEDAVIAFNKDLKANGFDVFSSNSLKKQYIFTAKPEWAGITFEIAYTAVDYEGKIAGRKFYITVAAE